MNVNRKFERNGPLYVPHYDVDRSAPYKPLPRFDRWRERNQPKSAFSWVSSDIGSHGSGAVGSLASAGKTHTAGNIIIVPVVWAGATGVTITGVAGSPSGDTYAQCTNAHRYDSTIGGHADCFWVITNGGTTDVVTLTFSSAGATFISFFPEEYSGGDSNSFEVATNGIAYAATSVASGSFAPASSGNLNVAIMQTSNGAGVYSADANYAIRSTDATYNRIDEDRLSAPSGAQTASFSGTVSTYFLMCVASFKPAAVNPNVTVNVTGVQVTSTAGYPVSYGNKFLNRSPVRPMPHKRHVY